MIYLVGLFFEEIFLNNCVWTYCKITTNGNTLTTISLHLMVEVEKESVNF